jgi:S1-C subfamily serine protease
VNNRSVRVIELLVAAMVGAGIVFAVLAGLGKLGDHTTIQQVSPLGGGGGVGNAALGTTTPTQGQQTPQAIYRQDSPGVVQITATTTTPATQSDPFNIFPTAPQTEQSLGSGFVIDKTGHIVTNYHVIANAQKVQVSFSGRDQIAATVVGKDPSTDVAVLKIDAHARALQPLPLGNSDQVVVGAPVYAIGNPFGLTRTLTSGLVSAVQRQIEAPNTLKIDHAIQTDAAINHGNSGGPLIDGGGRVIGVTSQIQTADSASQGNVGIGFAIPINTVRNVASQIIATGKAQHAFLGLDAADVTPTLVRLFNLPTKSGLLIQDVQSGSGADKAGLKPGTTPVVVQGQSYKVGGDIIVAADGQPVSTFEQLRDAISRKKPGDSMKLDIYRNGSKKSVTVKLGQRPDSK